MYLQGDYIVKPEYLEWQIFFSGFYNEKNRGDNTLSSAKYYSEPQKTNGDSTLDGSQASLYGDTATAGKFKQYKPEQEAKVVDLGVSLNVKEISKNMGNINLENIQPVAINSPATDISTPLPPTFLIPQSNFVNFAPSISVIPTINFNSIPVINLSSAGGGNDGYTGFYPTGDPNRNAVISQMDVISGEISAHIYDHLGGGHYDSKVLYDYYNFENLVGGPSPGLTLQGQALPAGIYNSSGIATVQGIFKVINNPITRFGTPGGNVNDLIVTLEGDDPNPVFLGQILHYDEHYGGVKDPITGWWSRYTLDEIETKGWITSAEKQDLGDKFLDTSLGHTAGNRWFQYVENNGTWNMKGSSVVAVNLQAHGGTDPVNSIFVNRGNITGLNEAGSINNLVGKQVAFVFSQDWTTWKQEGFDNTGKVEMRAPESVGYLISNSASSYVYKKVTRSWMEEQLTQGTGKHILMNSGDMKLYGNNNIGVYTSTGPLMIRRNSENYYSGGSWTKEEEIAFGLQRSEIRFNNPLTVLGDQSIGVDIERELNFANSKIKIDVGTEDPRQNVASATGVNGLENSGNIAGGDSSYTDGSVGIYVNMTGNIVDTVRYVYDQNNSANNVYTTTSERENPQFTLSDYLLNVGSYSRGGAGLRVEEYGDVILGSSSDASTNHEINLLAGGKNNAGIYISGSNAQVTTNGMKLNIAGTEQVGAQIENNSKFFHNNGIITINGTNNTGIAVKTTGYGELSGTGNITAGAGNLGVYNNETFNMTGGNITANGKAATGVYSAPSNTGTNLSGGTVRAENGGIGLYADNGSVMNLNQGLILQTGNKGLTVYNYDNSGNKGKYNMTGTVSGVVENGGTAFYVKNGQALTNYLTDSFTGSGKLDLTMQSGSKLYMLEGKGTTLNLTTADSVGAPGALLTQNVGISSASASDYIPLSMDKGTLVIDRNVNKDSSSDVYNRSEFTSVSVNVNNGTSITGTQTAQSGIAQKNYAGTSGINEITLNNAGLINMSGAGSVGIAADYGHVINSNKIQVAGANSIGIVSANGTQTENNGEIVVGGTDTAGIYGVNYLDGITSS